MNSAVLYFDGIKLILSSVAHQFFVETKSLEARLYKLSSY